MLILSVVVLSLIYAGCHYAEYHGTVMGLIVRLIIMTFNAYAECHYAECHHNLIDCAEYH
jgi:hypothetical protein